MRKQLNKTRSQRTDSCPDTEHSRLKLLTLINPHKATLKWIAVALWRAVHGFTCFRGKKYEQKITEIPKASAATFLLKYDRSCASGNTQNSVLLTFLFFFCFNLVLLFRMPQCRLALVNSAV